MERVIKTITYKIGSTLLAIIIVYIFIGRWYMATIIGLLDLLASSAWYYGHEWLWEHKKRREVEETLRRWDTIWPPKNRRLT